MTVPPSLTCCNFSQSTKQGLIGGRGHNNRGDHTIFPCPFRAQTGGVPFDSRVPSRRKVMQPSRSKTILGRREISGFRKRYEGDSFCFVRMCACARASVRAGGSLRAPARAGGRVRLCVCVCLVLLCFWSATFTLVEPDTPPFFGGAFLL